MNYALPPIAKYAVAAGLAAVVYLLGVLQGERHAGEAHIEYVERQALADQKLVAAREKVVVQTEVKYRDRIKTIYVKGEESEKLVPVYVTPADDHRYGVNAGFVRHYNAVWAGAAPGPAADSDREPAGVSLSGISEVEAHNATSCRAWRELAIGLREHYEKLKAATP